MIFLLPFFALSAIFGIDFGCEYIKVGMVQPGRGVHVALNQQSKRLSPSYFSFWNISNPRAAKKVEHWTLKEIEDCNWAFLDAAKSHSLRFPDNMIKGISPILGNINGLTRREIMALVLRHLITTVDEARWTPEVAQIVLSVEPFLPRADRYAIAEAIRLSNATLAAIIDSPTAAAQVYALEKRSLYIDQAKHVLFIDYGATFTWAAVFKFEDIEDTPVVQELSIVTNTSLGGNLMDQELGDFLIQKFSEMNKIERPTNKRFVARFIEEARRAKEILTLNKDVDINLEDVYEDYGLHYHLTREQFEDLIQDCNQSLRYLFNEALEKAGINGTQLDSIELIGGITRVPYVQKVLMEISGMEKLNRTMNSDEVVALGAGYRGASNSAAFIVKKIELSPFVNTNISIIHNGQTHQLFNQSSLLNETVDYVFNASNNSEITIVAETNLSTFIVNLPENTTDDALINITFHFDDLTIPNISTIYINNTLYNDSILNFSFPDWALTDEQFQNSTDFIHRMDEILSERARFAKIKNDYESYIYRIKNNLIYNITYKKVVNETERENLTNIACEHEQWLFENHPDPLNESMISDKLSELRNQVYHAEHRAEEYIRRAPAFNRLNNSLNYVFRHLNQTWPEQKPWLTDDQLYNVWEQYNRTREWFDDKYEMQHNTSDFEDPVVSVNEIEHQRLMLEWNFNSTNRIKKPTPTPPPKTIPLNESDISFININGHNVSIINGSIQGEFINGTFVPLNDTDINETIFNGTLVNGTLVNGTLINENTFGVNSTETNATENVNATDTTNSPNTDESTNSTKTEEEINTNTEKTEKKTKIKDKKKKKDKKKDKKDESSESSESSEDDKNVKEDL